MPRWPTTLLEPMDEGYAAWAATPRITDYMMDKPDQTAIDETYDSHQVVDEELGDDMEV